MPKIYDPEFRRRVVELIRSGRSVASVAADLGLAEATVYRWKAQDLIDRGEREGPTSVQPGELPAARRRIRSGSWRPSWSCAQGKWRRERHQSALGPLKEPEPAASPETLGKSE